MNDNDYIKAGIELADGWRLTSHGLRINTELVFECDGRFTITEILDHSWIKDALAAQLVRQVQALAKNLMQPWVWTNILTAVRRQNLSTDITMFTIKYIVDSKVLAAKDKP